MARNIDTSKFLHIDLQLFPSVNYCSTLLNNSNIVFEQYEHYRKTGFANRYEIRTPEGRLKLSVPLKGGRDQRTPVKDLEIDVKTDWQTHHWRTLVSCYARSPFFEFYAPMLEPLIMRDYRFLIDLQMAAYEFLFRVVRKKPLFRLSETFEKTLPSPHEDARHRFDRHTDSRIVYPQLFEERSPFQKNLSILDLLCMVGPDCFYFLSINN